MKIIIVHCSTDFRQNSVHFDRCFTDLNFIDFSTIELGKEIKVYSPPVAPGGTQIWTTIVYNKFQNEIFFITYRTFLEFQLKKSYKTSIKSFFLLLNLNELFGNEK
uniref:(northern house mosquito) hypothetical protein n=1 Tax=Culex pipiens TaxID=7175 RepID=A0A8D7ZSZ3_CULPI